MKKDILKEEFDREIELPESLSKGNVIKMLQTKEIKPEKKTGIRIIPGILSAAAMLVIITVAVFSLSLRSEFVDIEQHTTVLQNTTAAVNEEGKDTSEVAPSAENSNESTPVISNLKVAKSEKDLKNHFLKMYAEGKIDDYIDTVFNYAGDLILYSVSEDKAFDSAESENMAEAPTMAPAAAVTSAAAQSNDSNRGNVPHGTTNVQVADVDEGDIIKNDGRYLYIVNHPGKNYSDTNGITIVDTESMNRVYRGKIELKDEKVLKELAEEKEKNRAKEYYTEPTTDMYIQDIYLDGDILTAVCTYNEKTYAVIYDITERHAPKEIRRFDQDGSYISSRMVNGILYTVTNYTVRGSSAEDVEEKAIPRVDCDCLLYSKCYIEDEDSTRYIVVSAADTRDKDSKINAISVLGDGFEIYSTAENLYVYCTDYDDVYGDDTAIVKTVVNSFALNGTEITHKATGSFNGTCINQYSFDEYRGNLRVAACYYDYRKAVDVSCVYVLDESLNIIGELIDIAEDEQVKAVRFMGDTGYVVTFRNTDPLFIIDFSDPTKPAITGELKIPGYSTYIHPIGNGYLVGIGYDGTDEDAKTDTVKVSVFDVRDKANPKETDTFVIKNAYSLVNENPKALFYYSERNMLGIPVSHYAESRNVKSLQTVTVKDGKIDNHLGYVHYSGEYGYYYYSDLFRGTYIGNLLYTIDNNEIIEHNLDTGERERSCTIVSDSDNTNKKTALDEGTTYKAGGIADVFTTAHATK